MFETLELQYLNKLVKGKVRDFPSPKTFHAIKVQCLGHNRIEPFTHVRGQFIVPIFTLVCDMSIQPRQRSDSTPPVVRAFDLSAKGLVEFSEFVQGVFQELRRIYLFSCVQRQIRLKPKIYPYALTCSRIGFGRDIVGNHVQPKCSNGIPKDLDIPDISFPLTMLVEQEPTLVKLKGARGIIPGFEREPDTPVFYKIRRLELSRTVAVFAFKLRQSTEPVKKSVVSDMDTDNHFVKRVPRDPRPVLMGAFEQLRQVRLKAETSGIQTIPAIIPFFQSKEVIMHISKVIKHVAQTHVLWVFAYLILMRPTRAFLVSLSFFHGLSRITRLSPTYVGRQDTLAERR